MLSKQNGFNMSNILTRAGVAKPLPYSFGRFCLSIDSYLGLSPGYKVTLGAYPTKCEGVTELMSLKDRRRGFEDISHLLGMS